MGEEEEGEGLAEVGGVGPLLSDAEGDEEVGQGLDVVGAGRLLAVSEEDGLHLSGLTDVEVDGERGGSDLLGCRGRRRGRGGTGEGEEEEEDGGVVEWRASLRCCIFCSMKLL